MGGAVLSTAGLLPDEAGILVGLGLLVYVSVLLYALACSVSAWRQAPVGTPQRRRASGFALAFGIRDALFVLAIVASVTLGPTRQIGGLDGSEIPPLFAAIAAILYGGLLAHAILRTQLFDLDLRVKVGISRGTVASIILVVVFVVAKLVETYLSRTVGFMAGSVVAGALLFLVPRLNKIGDKVASTALPSVQPTSEYLAYKKLEVYRAAVESAQETGGITPKDRAFLDRLRSKLGLSPEDARALEAELTTGG